MDIYTFLKIASSTVFGLMGGYTVYSILADLIDNLGIDIFDFAAVEIFLLLCGITLVTAAFLIWKPNPIVIKRVCTLSLLSSIVLFFALWLLIALDRGYDTGLSKEDMVYFLYLLIPFAGIVLSILSRIFLPSHC